MKIYKLMMEIAGSYGRYFRRSLVYTIIATLIQVASYAVLVPLMMAICHDKPNTEIWSWVGFYAATIVVEVFFRLKSMNFNYQYWPCVIGEQRIRLAEALYKMPLLQLREKDVGDLSEIMGSNVMNAANALSSLANIFVEVVSLPILLWVAITLFDYRMGLILAVSLIAMLPILYKIQAIYNSSSADLDRADAESASRIIEYVKGIAVFKATSQAGAKSPRLEAVFHDQQDIQSHGNKSSASYISLCQFIVQLALVILIAFAGYLAQKHSLNIPKTVALVIIAVHIIEPLNTIAAISKLFEIAEISLQRIKNILNSKGLPQLQPQAIPQKFDINFNQVTFEYPDSPVVLHDIDLALPSESLTGVVGSSGCGKTTLVQLIARFADPTKGEIKIGGVDIRSLTQSQLSSLLSIVYQDVWLFNDTIRANILMGRPEATEEELIHAAQSANIHDFICSLPQGYDTLVGEVGSSLSGGERQRISIARAILKNTPIIILDEPTASLDSESEYAVQRAISSLIKGKTVIMVAHRLNTLTAADKIIVLDRGSIIEEGCHEDLIKNKSYYYNMWNTQLKLT
ncbi:MAG: ABC transporter ATP-binding protein [Zymomonas mobilis]|uniref:ABC transporter ATP-binding protein n=1 Tax=Zymomonas mobilis TaxID=542 RepID=UPI0039E8E8F0